MAIDGPTCSPVLLNSVFQSNNAQEYGAGIAVTNIASSLTVSITGCTLTGNLVGAFRAGVRVPGIVSSVANAL